MHMISWGRPGTAIVVHRFQEGLFDSILQLAGAECFGPEHPFVSHAGFLQ
jgi:hypothetical protein